MASVELASISKSFGAVDVIRDLSLSVEDGSFCALLGPSGCGKSTLLRMIAGLERVSGGSVRIGSRDVTHAEPKSRGVAMVFQSYALYPHLTVAQNIAFSLSLAGRPRAEQRAAAERVARLLQLDHLLDRRPAELSGGQRQRVAIGRALVREPQVFLFDEPLSNLDALLRVQMRIELAKLHNEIGTTMIYVTHDQVEAMTLADRIVVLDRGRIQQVGSPLELYNHPANRFVAGFIGSPGMNFVPVDSEGRIPGGGRLPAVPPGATELGIRPEHLRLTGPGEGHLDARATVVEHLGNTSFVYLDSAAGQMIVEADAGYRIVPGDTVGLAFDPARIHAFDDKGLAIG
ncbi:carbohydrate ABC transporter ATP-binding protein, CUT1 family [Rubellimicrobium thermophilum DSM 16684]|uniref:Carbohydrate ABC transporter ATP-binding protein, CUT1 family n=1 Tax=Rubellimicrobium thermophilum DSM 16684 TaxID=1123069 RepID=S9R6Z0_9RHOB|nr:ABC transporter ATP-binding protein [Rubellimicrobium thermophilum]EPX87758.1 carbohydrate ABC transporter ATP-binding protein, CUT1 family [Rubellimicrobium thermophilum DSM 16684]